jgi:rhodanese-related sulfurtransferase
MEAKRDQKMSDIVNLDPAAVRAGLDAGSIILVDVRETHEFAARRIEGSVNLPLSRFDPAELPAADGKTIVFMCAGGVRSVRAIDVASAVGLPWNQHLAGGINAWVQAGEPTS